MIRRTLAEVADQGSSDSCGHMRFATTSNSYTAQVLLQHARVWFEGLPWQHDTAVELFSCVLLLTFTAADQLVRETDELLCCQRTTIVATSRASKENQISVLFCVENSALDSAM